VAAYETRLKTLEEDISALLDWLVDDFVQRSTEGDDARRTPQGPPDGLILDAKGKAL
jgi:hypothetical protein